MLGIATALIVALGQPAGCPAVSAHVYRIALYARDNTLREYGAGFFASADGLFVTARHVYQQGGRGARAVVEIGDERRTVTAVAAESRELDIIVLRVDLGSARINVPPVANNEVRVGDAVVGFRIPWPASQGIYCTAGRIAAISPREITVRGDAFFMPGSSGAPVFNEAGQAVAVAMEMVNTKATGKPDWVYTALPVREALSLALGRVRK